MKLIVSSRQLVRRVHHDKTGISADKLRLIPGATTLLVAKNEFPGENESQRESFSGQRICKSQTVAVNQDCERKFLCRAKSCVNIIWSGEKVQLAAILLAITAERFEHFSYFPRSDPAFPQLITL